MLIPRAATIVAAVGFLSMSLPVLADDMKSGSEIMMIMHDGRTGAMPMMDKAKMEMMLKNAEEVKDDMAIFVWGNKLYIAKNTKMADGRMTFDAWGAHFEK